jgi:uncharacterized membrane protein
MGAGDDTQAMVSRSLRSRIMVAYALCAIAESEIQDGDLQRALKTTETVRKLIAEIALLVSDPNTISPSLIRETAEMLAELESRVVSVEAALGGPPA